MQTRLCSIFSDNKIVIFFSFLLKTWILEKKTTTLEPPRRERAVLTYYHDLCFRAKRKKMMSTPVDPSLTARTCI